MQAYDRRMKRPRAHTIADRAERLFENRLPDAWIKRRIVNDYGIDYEIEIVDEGLVTGKRVWLQLKGHETMRRRSRLPWVARRAWESDTDLVDHVRVRVPTPLLSYALNCDFPLLLAAADLECEEVFCVGLRDYIDFTLPRVNPQWRTRQSATIYIESTSTITQNDAEQLRWYGLELARRNALGLVALATKAFEANGIVSYLVSGDLDTPNRAERAMLRLQIFRNALRFALDFDVLFGDRGIDDLRAMKPVLVQGLATCEEIQRAIANGRPKEYSAQDLAHLAMAEVTLPLLDNVYEGVRSYRVLAPAQDPVKSFAEFEAWLDDGMWQEWK